METCLSSHTKSVLSRVFGSRGGGISVQDRAVNMLYVQCNTQRCQLQSKSKQYPTIIACVTVSNDNGCHRPWVLQH